MSARPTHAGHQARKRFGQHFLHDPRVIERIVAAIDPRRDDALVEIGPGLGALTRPLLQRLDRLEAIEIDRDLVAGLSALGPALVVHNADALKFDYAQLAPASGLRVVGNLPYNISTPLLFHLLGFASCIRDMHFMLQKEVVTRMAAAPGSRDYGRLTVALAARAEVRALFDVGAGAFRPPPQVGSAVVRIVPRPPAFTVRDWGTFDRVVTRAFGQRRKTLANALKGTVPAEAIAASGIDPGCRAETLPAEAFARLANAVAAGP